VQSNEEVDRERERREAEELESFGRRAEWWQRHYGMPAEEADERMRKAAEDASRMPDEDEPDEHAQT
jgi:hypothetical protein